MLPILLETNLSSAPWKPIRWYIYGCYGQKDHIEARHGQRLYLGILNPSSLIVLTFIVLTIITRYRWSQRC